MRLLVAAAVPLLHLYSPDASAQVASTQRVQGTPSATATPQAAAATVSLQLLLKRWASSYHTTIAYDNEVVEGKQVTLPHAGKELLEDKLRSVLPQAGLMFKKLHTDNYVVVPTGTGAVVAPAGPSPASTPERKAGTVTGRVTDTKGAGLPGATVLLKGTTNGTGTDENGNFVLSNVPAGSHTLVLSSVGFKSKEVPVTVTADGATVNAQLSDDATALEDVIVTGTTTPQKKIESSVAISTLSARTLEARAPLNSADAIKAIPGVFVASSGGDGPGNVRVRGLPTGGGYTFFGIMEDGLPVLPTGFNSSPSPDQNFKVDLTLKDIEAIRGGSAPLVLVNTPGAVMNNLSYTGADKPYGKVKFTTGLSQGLYRLDANQGGRLSPKVMYNIGGFYRTDKGIKPATFQANQGGQLKANLTYDFSSKGYIRVYGKYLNDITTWVLPSLYAYNEDRKSEPVQGFDMYTQSLIPRQTEYDLRLPEGTTTHINLADGFHTRLGYGGLLFNYATDNGWNFRNNFRYQYTTNNFSYAQVTAVTPFASNRNYYYADNGTQLTNPTGSYVVQLVANTQRADDQVIDYLDVNKKLGRNNLTLGGGLYRYNVRNSETVNGTIATEIANQPRLLVVGSPTASVLTPAANTTQSGHTLFSGGTNMFSAYVSDELAVTDKLRLDGGLRVDFFNVNGSRGTYAGSSTAAGGPGFTLNGSTPFNESNTYYSASLGANYRLLENLAFFARATRTYSAFLITEYAAIDYNPANLRDRHINLGEVGLKYGTGALTVFSSVAYTRGTNLPLNVGVPTPTGAITNVSTYSSTRSISWETEATLRAFNGLTLRLTSTVQNPVFTDYMVTIPSTARADIAGKTYDWSGNAPQSTPKVNFQLQANYDYKYFSVYATSIYNGSNYTTSAATYKLPGYNELTAGVSAKALDGRLELRAWSTNLLNTHSLTEGNVRGEQFLNTAALTPGQVMIGRAILPRSFWLSIAYGFGSQVNYHRN